MYLDHEETLNIANNAESEIAENEKKPFKMKIVWFNTIGFLILHVASVYGLYLAVTSTKLLTLAWSKSKENSFNSHNIEQDLILNIYLFIIFLL